MTPDILIIRDDKGYRLLHGHLRLVNALNSCSEVFVEIKDEGKASILKTAQGLMVGLRNQYYPLLRN